MRKCVFFKKHTEADTKINGCNKRSSIKIKAPRKQTKRHENLKHTQSLLKVISFAMRKSSCKGKTLEHEK